MKKKILTCLGIFLTLIIILTFFIMGSIKKTPTTPEKFISIMTANSINAWEETNSLDENSKQIISRAINADNLASFAKCHNINSARWLFDDYGTRIHNANIQAGSTKFNDVREFSNNHYQYKSYSTSSGYFVIVQVEDTVLQFVVNNKVKDKVNNIIKELGYDVGININIMSYFTILSMIFGALLIVICFVSIFKKHNIHPLFVVVPIINFFYLCKIADKSGWKMFLFLIPIFNFFYYFILMYKLAKIYTNKKLICFGMGFLPLILLPLIAFDKPRNNEKTKNVYEEILK